MHQRISHYQNVPILLFILIFLGFISWIFMGTAAAEQTITVDQNGGGDFTTIQEAVDAADDGDTLQVMEGTYAEHVIVNKSLLLIGSSASSCVVDAGGDGVALLVENTDATIRDLTVTGGGCCNGAGLKVKNSKAMISGINCTGNRMGGLHLINSTASVTNSTFWNNSFVILTFLLRDSVIANCTLDRNGVGLYIRESFSSHLADLSVTGIGFPEIQSDSVPIQGILFQSSGRSLSDQ